mmetsp:Transcript_34850/g.63509  ORF Transcript_34850/g.63509 Transcript_34850/m.63509 type:complete len:224 (-) Transcript_34850:3-674(-)
MQLAVDPFHIGHHRVRRDLHELRDLVEGEALGREVQHARLLLGQGHHLLVRQRSGHGLGRRALPTLRTRRTRRQTHQQPPRDHRADRAAARAQRAQLAGQVQRQAVLQQIAGGARLDAGNDMLLIAEDGNHHHLALGPRLRRVADQLDAAATGQVQVHQQHIGLQLVEHAPALGQVGRNAQQFDVGHAAEGMGERIPEAGLVFDNQDRERSHALRWTLQNPKR